MHITYTPWMKKKTNNQFRRCFEEPDKVYPFTFFRIAAALKSSEQLRMTQPLNVYNNTIGWVIFIWLNHTQPLLKGLRLITISLLFIFYTCSNRKTVVRMQSEYALSLFDSYQKILPSVAQISVDFDSKISVEQGLDLESRYFNFG